MTLNEANSLIVQSTTCELDMLEMGDIKCANVALNYRHSAQLRTYIIDCLNDDYTTNKAVINYLFEQVKELLLMITQNEC